MRSEENERLYAALYEATPGGMRTDLVRLREVPERRPAAVSDHPALTRPRLVQVDHINFFRRRAFTALPVPGQRPLRDPYAEDNSGPDSED